MILRGTVSHTRFSKRHHHFKHKSWYVLTRACASGYKSPYIARNRIGLISIHDKDYGFRDTRSLEEYLTILHTQFLADAPVNTQSIKMITMPRVLGYAFNPVTFFLCPDVTGALIAVLCEVHNTFGESHTYICRHADYRPILPNDCLTAEKIFHVSPFFDRKGQYVFRFICNDSTLFANIEYKDHEGHIRLHASLVGKWKKLTASSLLRSLVTNPHPSIKTWVLIHIHAFKLWVIKRIPYVKKPAQDSSSISETK